MQELKQRINVTCVDTENVFDRNNEFSDEPDQPVEEALSPFANVDRASMPSGYDRPSLLKQEAKAKDEAE